MENKEMSSLFYFPMGLTLLERIEKLQNHYNYNFLLPRWQTFLNALYSNYNCKRKKDWYKENSSLLGPLEKIIKEREILEYGGGFFLPKEDVVEEEWMYAYILSPREWSSKKKQSYEEFYEEYYGDYPPCIVSIPIRSQEPCPFKWGDDGTMEEWGDDDTAQNPTYVDLRFMQY